MDPSTFQNCLIIIAIVAIVAIYFGRPFKARINREGAEIETDSSDDQRPRSSSGRRAKPKRRS